MAKKVLMVATDHAQLAAMTGLLQTQGYLVETATDGEEAWTVFQQQQPEVVISALRMPNLDGIGLLKRVRSHPSGAAIPFVLLSTAGFSDYETEAKNQGATAFLYLPLQDAAELVRWIGT